MIRPSALRATSATSSYRARWHSHGGSSGGEGGALTCRARSMRRSGDRRGARDGCPSVWARLRRSTSSEMPSPRSPRSSGIREVVRVALDGVVPRSGRLRAQIVNRWDRPYAALVARARGTESAHLDPYLDEAAAALAPMLERTADVDRRLEEERNAV